MIKVFDTNAEYHANKAISASGLKDIISQSVYYKLNKKYTESEAMKFGTAVHTLLGEGRKEFKRQYYFMPNLDFRFKKNKEIKKVHEELAEGKIVFNSQQGRDLYTILKNFESNKLAVYYCNGITERSHYTEFEGIPVRVRPDCLGDDWISDIKTSRDIGINAFRSEVKFRNYDLQAAFYSDVLGYDPLKFRFVAIRNSYPFDNAVYSLNEDQIELGRFKYRKALNEWKHYLDTGEALGIYSANQNNDGSIIL